MITQANYISYIVSPWQSFLSSYGYDRLDVNQYPDGSWDIIEFMKVPLVPCIAKYRTILGNMKNIEISKGFLLKYIDEIDTNKRKLWAREEAKSKRVHEESIAAGKAGNDRVEQAFRAVKGNEALRQRVAKNGLHEMNLDRIYRHIPRQQRRGLK